MSVAAQAVALGLHTPLLDPLAPHLDGDELPDGDLQGYVCGTATHELRFVPSATPRTTTEVVQRWMITHLPAPDPQMTPTPGVAVPLGVPVFVTIPAAQWQPVDATLSHAGTTAEVRAAPVSLRVIPGDPAAATVECDGPGIGYRSGQPIAEQAEAAGACVLRYRTATRGGTSPRRGPEAASSRPPLWLGTVTVVWEASWRVDGGPWRDLGPVPRTRLVTRAAREVTTSVETPR